MSEPTVTPDAEDRRAARHARIAAMLERANDVAAAMIERGRAAAEAAVAAGRYDPAAEDLRARTLERACRTLRRNGAYLDALEMDDTIIAGRIHELRNEKRQAVRKRARQVELVMLEAVDAGQPGKEATERLLAGLYDWLDLHAWDDDFRDDPVLMIVRAACHDLGFDLTYVEDAKGQSTPVITLPDAAPIGPAPQPCQVDPAPADKPPPHPPP